MSGILADLAQHGFLRNALLGGILTSVVCGVVGSLAVVRKMGYVAGGVAHASLGGIGAALLFGASSLWGASAAAVAGALLLGWMTLRGRENEDTAISALWSVGMAAGVVCLSRVDGYAVDPSTFLFGNILLIPADELLAAGIIDAAALAVAILLYHPFKLCAFDEELARIQGLPVAALHLLLMTLLALVVVALIQVVGLLMVIALLTLPAATARRFSRSLSGMMVRAAAVGSACTAVGLLVAWDRNLPAGATIILLAGGVYFGAVLLQRLKPHRGER